MNIPTVHLNGTSRNSLVQQRIDLIDALENVEKAIALAWPHGRDYYPQGPDALFVAQRAWTKRMNVINTLREEITEESQRIFDQEGA